MSELMSNHSESPRPAKRVIAVHDLSCVGRCALTLVIPALAAMGVQPVPLPTAVLSAHTGFPGVAVQHLDGFMAACRDNRVPEENVEVIRETPEEILKRETGLAVKTAAGEYAADGVFVLREAVAPSQLVPGLETDGAHVKVNRRMETNLPGLFACGDLTGTPYQYVKAAGEGNVAAISAAAYIDKKAKE